MRRRFLAPVLVFAVLGIPAAPVQAATPQQVLVRFVDGTPATTSGALLARLGLQVTGGVYGTDVLVVRGPAVSAEALSARLSSLRVVEYAEPDFPLSVTLTAPNDPRYGDQYALQRISALAGWAHYPGSYSSSGGPTIAIIDTGIQASHEDLAGRVDTQNSNCFLGLLCAFGGYNDDNGHGTHVAGTAAASTDNGRGVAGVSYNSRIMALKVCNMLGTCNTSAVASAVLWARDRGAAVINMSLGGSGDSATLRNAVRDAWDGGIVLVAAAGNNGNSSKSYPAAYPHVISVAATDSADRRASFSQFNDDVELAAPGVGVLSTYTGNRYRSLSGTSMASPHVAGLAALLIGQNPGWTNAQVRQRMRACADDLGEPGRDDHFGHGRINLARTLGSC